VPRAAARRVLFTKKTKGFIRKKEINHIFYVVVFNIVTLIVIVVEPHN
jgi:hypothetical protein